jgi:cystathionine beta-lyase/cystathionine gamma-synthase
MREPGAGDAGHACVRFSIGLEALADLRADLQQALVTCDAAPSDRLF